jgi:hypothetical protein
MPPEQKRFVSNNLNAQDYYPAAVDKLKREVSEPVFGMGANK